MTSQEKSKKAFVSVVQMAEMLDLSKSRFYTLIQAGIFPQPVRHASCKRPVFDADSQQKCLDIRQSGIGHNGNPVLFNRKRRKPTQPKSRQDRQSITEEQTELVEALKSLGLTVIANGTVEAQRKAAKDANEVQDGVRRGILLRG
jgi:hypothetical protein